MERIVLPTYNPTKVLKEFHRSNKFFRGIRGPVGSGKSTACVMEILFRALRQKAWEGERMSRWVVIRNTANQLLTTTLKTWEAWIPRRICEIRETVPITARVKFGLEDGTFLNLEVLFIALDKEEDVGKLKSLELTGGWVNEASEVEWGILQMLFSRVGRYPSKIYGGPSWFGVIADTNPPDETHWWFQKAEVEKPEDFEFFNQPPAVKEVKTDKVGKLGNMVEFVVNPEAENLDNLPPGYYEKLLQTSSVEWIRVYLANQYGSTHVGRVVYPEYVDSVHYLDEEWVPPPGSLIIVGWDFGLNVSTVFTHLDAFGRLHVFDEIVGENIGVKRFIEEKFMPLISKKYAGYRFYCIGDPAGTQRTQTTEQTCFDILNEHNIVCVPAPTNEFIARREAVSRFLGKLVHGRPGLIVSKNAAVIRNGFLRNYHYKKVKGLAGEHYLDKPEKNLASHIHDALQYVCLYLVMYGDAFKEDGIFLTDTMSKRIVPVSSKVWA